jgi:cytosine/adenosine deaminase-related metal-dependent hydrolase
MILKDVLVVTPRSDAAPGHLDVKLASIGIEDGVIRAVGAYADVRRKCSPEGTEIAAGPSDQLPYVALPGFIDGHSHSRQIAFQAYSESGWQHALSRPQNADEAVALFRWFVLEAAKAGVTFLCDWPEHPQLWNPAPLDEELRAIGLRGCLRVLLPHNRGKPWPELATSAENLRQTVRGLADGTCLGVWIPEEDRQEFNPALLATLGRLQAAIADEPIVFQMHLAESQKRKLACPRPLARLLDHGLIHASAAARTLLVHAIWSDGDELQTLIDHREHLGVITCPKFVDGRVAPIKELLQGGVAVGLGSDVAAPDSLDLVRNLLALHESRPEPLRLGVGEALHAATLGGARALGMDRRIGSIEEGKDADIVLAKLPAALDPELLAAGEDEDRRQAKMRVIERLFTRNVLRKEHVDKVFVRGRLIVDDGIVVSRAHEAAIAAAGRGAARAIMKRLADRRTLGIG